MESGPVEIAVSLNALICGIQVRCKLTGYQKKLSRENETIFNVSAEVILQLVIK